MSVRELSDGSQGDSGVTTIENIADTKGVDLDDIEHESGTTEDGDSITTYNVYSTKAETEEDSVGFQVTKFHDAPMSEQTFRTDVQNKLSKLKNYISSDGDDVEDVEDRSEETTDVQRQDTSQSTADPEVLLLRERQRQQERIDELEDRVEELEQLTDGLKQLMGGDTNDAEE